jgi:hypothetical protein
MRQCFGSFSRYGVPMAGKHLHFPLVDLERLGLVRQRQAKSPEGVHHIGGAEGPWKHATVGIQSPW